MPVDPCHYYYDSALSRLYLCVADGEIQALEYEPESVDTYPTALPQGELKSWLDDYFAGKPPAQMPPLQMSGSEFQQAVWKIMLSIPYGATMTYGEAATLLDSAARAVGQACRSNKIPILIPCHRIVAKQSIGGYEGMSKGHRVDRKKWLLDHEKLS